MATLTKSTGTVTLSGAVEKVSLPAVYGWVWTKNMSDADMFLGLDDGVSAGADGVMRIPAGECGRVQTDGQDSVYLMGSGNALVVAQNYADCPFKLGGKGGESPDLSAYAKTADVAAALADKINDNLLINPDFKINQRGASGTVVPQKNADGDDIHTYFVDRWGIDNGSVIINADGTLTLNGTISQIFENAVGTNVVASASAGTAVYDNSTKTFSITANGETVSWAKLEYGDTATAFVVPDPATELMKCMRYYEILLPSAVDRSVVGYLEADMKALFDIKFSVPKRCPPTLMSSMARIIVNTIGSYIVISNYCTIKQTVVDNHGISIYTVDPIISSSPTGYTAVTMDAMPVPDIAVDAEIY